jgi:hypothetical protein
MTEFPCFMDGLQRLLAAGTWRGRKVTGEGGGKWVGGRGMVL